MERSAPPSPALGPVPEAGNLAELDTALPELADQVRMSKFGPVLSPTSFGLFFRVGFVSLFSFWTMLPGL